VIIGVQSVVRGAKIIRDNRFAGSSGRRTIGGGADRDLRKNMLLQRREFPTPVGTMGAQYDLDLHGVL